MSEILNSFNVRYEVSRQDVFDVVASIIVDEVIQGNDVPMLTQRDIMAHIRNEWESKGTETFHSWDFGLTSEDAKNVVEVAGELVLKLWPHSSLGG